LTDGDGSSRPTPPLRPNSAKNGYVVRVSRQAETFTSFLVEAVSGLSALIAGALLISSYLAMRLARRIAKPLRVLEEAARTGTAPDLSVTGIRELDVLAAALRTGAQAEHERREALVIEVQRRETEEGLRRADRQKDIFLATLAHELRNPLAPIRTAAQMLKLAAPDDDRVQRAREVIERQVTHMARLVDDLLDISKITFGMTELSQVTSDLVTLTRAACDASRPVMNAAGLQFEEQIPAGARILVSGDPVRLSQCISNVLTNAIKFTPRGGRVQLSLTQQESIAEISVADSGIGIAEEALERVFLLFAQEQVSGLSGTSGLGIGLALTRKLVEMHGGTITATSDGAGRGSTFRIRLPVTSPAPGYGPAQAQVAHASSLPADLHVDD
jgi:signal transduction histidine kinase